MSTEIQTKIEGETVLLSFTVDRLDASLVGRLKPLIEAALPPGIKTAEVDLAPVGFIDSSGVGLLLGIYRRLPGETASVTLKNCTDGVRSVIELLRLHRVFKVVP